MAAAVRLQGQASAAPEHRQAPNAASCKGGSCGDLTSTAAATAQLQAHESPLSPPERCSLCPDCISAWLPGKFSAPSHPVWKPARSTADLELQMCTRAQDSQCGRCRPKWRMIERRDRLPKFCVRSCWISISLFSRVSIRILFSHKTLNARTQRKMTHHWRSTFFSHQTFRFLSCSQQGRRDETRRKCPCVFYVVMVTADAEGVIQSRPDILD